MLHIFSTTIHARRLIVPTLCVFLLTLSACASAPITDTSPTSFKKASALLHHGVTLFAEYDYEKSHLAFEQALIEYRRIDNPEGIAKSCLGLAKIAQTMNKPIMRDRYLNNAERLIKRYALTYLHGHLAIQKSASLINEQQFVPAKTQLKPYLNSQTIAIKLAALQNRTRIAFSESNEDRTYWLQQYSIAITDKLSDHAARALRFEAGLSKEKQTTENLLTQALNIYRERGNQPGIAATLTQWAVFDINRNKYGDAQDKLQRALFIRQHLNDSKHALIILKQLEKVYQHNNAPMLSSATRWIKLLKSNAYISWSAFIADFDSYPKISR